MIRMREKDIGQGAKERGERRRGGRSGFEIKGKEKCWG